MRKNFKFKDKEDLEINCYKWTPDNDIEIKGVIQLVHGMAENITRYDYFAEKLCKDGYIVYGHDHRGHGFTAKKNLLGYIADDDGFNWMLNDIKELTDIIKEENKDLPIILFGHSMGSFLSQRYIELYGSEIKAVILSGTNGKPSPLVKLGKAIAKFEMNRKGRKNISSKLEKLSFGSFNKHFNPVRTSYDWICSVDEEVDKYIDNKYCGFTCTSSFYYDLFNGFEDIHNKKNLNKIPKNLPIYIFAGEEDPVGNFGKGILNLYNIYKDLEIKDVEFKLYKNGRHEMLNEYNKDQVIEDILSWLKSRVY